MRRAFKRWLCARLSGHEPFRVSERVTFGTGEIAIWRGMNLGTVLCGHIRCTERYCWCGEKFHREALGFGGAIMGGEDDR